MVGILTARVTGSMQNLVFVEKVVKRTIGGILYDKITQNLKDFSGTRDFLRNKMLQYVLVLDSFLEHCASLSPAD